MEKIAPEFKDDEELSKMILVAVLTIVFWLFAPLIAYLAFKETLSPAAKDVVKALLNFEIFVAIFVFVSTIVPLLGWFLTLPIFTAIHYIVTIIVTINVCTKSEINVWVPYKFVK